MSETHLSIKISSMLSVENIFSDGSTINTDGINLLTYDLLAKRSVKAITIAIVIQFC